MKKLNLKLGCDPELFLCDGQMKLISAIGRVGGSKHAPMPLITLGDGFAVQEDNVAVEFNIPPASNAEEFMKSVERTMTFLRDGMKSQYGLDISKLSAAHFENDQLDSPMARVFGCDPDFNAWTGKRNPRPHAADPNLRSCGGHIHVGYDKSLAKATEVIKAMDLFLGIPSVLMDKGELRKELYGKAGAYREKQYGAEYRTLSNFWVQDTRLCQWAWENTERAVNAVVAQFPLEEDKDLILEAINANNKDAAIHLVYKHKLDVVHV